MNCLHFALWLTGIYFLYYLVMILWDSAKERNISGARPLTKELTFMVDEKPQVVEPPVSESPPDQPVSAESVKAAGKGAQPHMIGSGGVTLKGLFGLARKESINYTRSVSY